jgi:hypothetical protein
MECDDSRPTVPSENLHPSTRPRRRSHCDYNELTGFNENGLCYTLTSMPNFEPIYEFVFTDHALIEMARREIVQEDVRNVLANPEQMEMVREGRAVYQAKLEMGQPPKMYVIRVFVDIDRDPPYVVTVYRTSKIEKYWR